MYVGACDISLPRSSLPPEDNSLYALQKSLLDAQQCPCPELLFCFGFFLFAHSLGNGNIRSQEILTQPLLYPDVPFSPTSSLFSFYKQLLVWSHSFHPLCFCFLSLRLPPQPGAFRGFTSRIDRYKHTQPGINTIAQHTCPDLHKVYGCQPHQMLWLLRGPSHTEIHGFRARKQTISRRPDQS